LVRQRVFSLVFILKNHSNSSLENGAFERVRDRISLAEFGQKRRKHRLACNSNAFSHLFPSHLTLSPLIFRKSSSRAGEKLSQISTRINNIKKQNLNSREIRTSRAARDSNAVNETRRVRSRRRCVHHFQIYLCACVLCVCRLRNAFFFCCLFFRFFPCFLLSSTNNFFFRGRGKNSIVPFVPFFAERKNASHRKTKTKKTKKTKNQRRGAPSRFVLVPSPGLSLHLSPQALKERESGVFFSKSKSFFLSRDKNSSGFLSSLSSSSSWRLLQRRRRLRRHFSRKTGAEEGKEALISGKASKLALLRRRRRRRNNKSGKRGLGWLFGRRLKKVLFYAKEEKTHRQR